MEFECDDTISIVPHKAKSNHQQHQFRHKSMFSFTLAKIPNYQTIVTPQITAFFLSVFQLLFWLAALAGAAECYNMSDRYFLDAYEPASILSFLRQKIYKA
ncbi:hypothetical protein TWF506_004887 [Arthrobotrys conoides]|uniref:Uncharacterized protein n=1 Tax=Arthrobotrys conoides TaxID=74498 RepID=A0AAN8RVM8_9PEZI